MEKDILLYIEDCLEISQIQASPILVLTLQNACDEIQKLREENQLLNESLHNALRVIARKKNSDHE